MYYVDGGPFLFGLAVVHLSSSVSRISLSLPPVSGNSDVYTSSCLEHRMLQEKLY